MNSVVTYLPESFRSGPGELNAVGLSVGLFCWGMLFLFLGMFVGLLLLKKLRRSVIQLEKENMKGFNRLEIYRATVEKQSESSFLRD